MGELLSIVRRAVASGFGRRIGVALAAALLGLAASRCHASGSVPIGTVSGYSLTCSSGSSYCGATTTVFSGVDRAALCEQLRALKDANQSPGTWTMTATTTGGAGFGVCTVFLDGSGVGQNFAAASVPGCGSNSTASGGACACNSGYVPNGGGTACVAQTSCSAVAGQTFAAGYFNLGSDVQVHIAVACGANECEVVYDGATAKEKRIVGGVEQWFAQGLYRYTGNACAGSTVSASAAPAAASAPPSTNTCASNQDGGTVNGVFKCFDRTTGTVAVAASTPSMDSTSTTSKVTNGDGSTTTTTRETKRDSAGNESTTTTVVTTNAAGTASTTTSTTSGTGATLAGGGGGGGGGGGCADNPSAAGCGGTPGAYNGQRTAGTDTFGGVLAGLRDQFGATALGTAVNGFFSVTGAGSCPSWNWHIPVIESDHVVDIFCGAWAASILALIKLVFLIVVTWFAFRVAVE